MPEKYNHTKFAEDIGFIKAKIEKIDNLEKLVQAIKERQDKMLGWASGVAAVVSVIFAIGKEFLGRVLNGKT